MSERLQDAWFLTGPTASGKTTVGIELARQLGAEIISLDSMALYRGMDIGTAKSTPQECQAVRHHLIDIIEPNEEFSVAQYLQAADAAARDIQLRRKQVLFVGGTALYLKVILRGLFSGPSADWKLRCELEEIARIEGPAALHRRLQEVDSTAAAKLHPNDVRRVVRALEVHQATGRPISSFQQQFDRGRPALQCRVFVLDWPRDKLDERMARRVDEMFAAGLVEEVRGLTAAGNLSRTAAQAVGYREVLEHLRGQRDLAATIALVKLRTRQFVKRQMTWFRSLSECRWVPMSGPFNPAQVAQNIAQDGKQIENAG